MSIQTDEYWHRNGNTRGCAVCKKQKGLLEFGLRADGKRGWTCVSCLQTRRAIAQANTDRQKRRAEWADIESERIQLKKRLIKTLAAALSRSKIKDPNVDFMYLFGLYTEQNGKCALTGEDMLFDPGPRRRAGLSIDRIDSSKGYEVGNIQLVTLQANIAKSNFTTEELFDFCLKVVRFNGLT